MIGQIALGLIQGGGNGFGESANLMPFEALRIVEY